LKNLNKNKRHTVLYQCCAIILIATLLTPSFVKLSHAFLNHEHNVCLDYQKTHFHEFDLDCEFYKFKLSKQFSHELVDYALVLAPANFQIATSQYHFVSEYQYLQTSLRGPPALI